MRALLTDVCDGDGNVCDSDTRTAGLRRWRGWRASRWTPAATTCATAATRDDNDGIPDSDDPGGRTSANATCVFNGPSSARGHFLTCRGGGCNMTLLRIVEAINPDPTRVFVFDVVTVERDKIVVEPLQNRTVAKSADVFRGSLPVGGRTQRGMLSMELVDARTGRAVEDFATFAPSSVTMSALGAARTLSPTINRQGSALAVPGMR